MFVLPWSLEHTGGVNEVVKSLMQCFREDGVFSPLLLITGERPIPNSTRKLEIIKTHFVEVSSRWWDRYPALARLFFVAGLPFRCWKIWRILARFKVKVVNAHFPDLGALLFVLLKESHLFSGKIIISFHGSDIQSALLTNRFKRGLWRILLRGADHIVVVSDGLGKEVQALEPKIAGKLRTAYSGVDVATFASAKRHQEPVGYDAHLRPTIISVAGFVNVKGHDTLLRAFSLVVTRIQEVRLLLVGSSGPEVERIRQLVNSLSLGESVEMFQDIPHEQIPAYLSRASLFALASRAEGGIPLALIEAGAATLPVVCTRAAGARELITDGVSGRLVDIDDYVALADTMVDMLTRPAEAKRMAANLYEFVTNQLTWQGAYQRYLDLVVPKPRL